MANSWAGANGWLQRQEETLSPGFAFSQDIELFADCLFDCQTHEETPKTQQ